MQKNSLPKKVLDKIRKNKPVLTTTLCRYCNKPMNTGEVIYGAHFNCARKANQISYE
jgi:hypothetical protein